MPEPARVVVLEGDYGVCAIQELELPDPGPGQALIEMYAAGVGHAQLHQIEEPRSVPLIPGREGAARVLATGAGVTRVAAGDAVLVTPWPAAAGEPRLPAVAFDDGSVAEVPPAGTWATNAVVDERLLVPMPDLPDKEAAAALGDTAMLALAAVRAAGVGAGERVAVFGCGGMGLAAIAIAVAAGADPVIAVDHDSARLDAARALGAAHALDADAAEGIADLAPGGVDRLLDCVYEYEAEARPGRGLVREGGSAVAAGVPGTDARREELAAIAAANGYLLPDAPDPDADAATLLAWVAEGRLPLETIIAYRCTIEQVNEVAQMLESGEIAGQAVMVIEPLR